MMQEYVTANEMAEKWNVNPRTIQTMCANGKIVGAKKFGKMWAIPTDAEKPLDARIKSGRYAKKKSK